MVSRITAALGARYKAIQDKEKGFTLIELLVVVIIIGILAAIAIPIFLGQQAQAKGSAVESAIANAKTDVVASIVDEGTFPTGAELTAAAGDSNIVLTIAGDEEAFCIAGTHAEISEGAGLKSWAADDTSGVVEGTCGGTPDFDVVPTP